MFPSPRILSSFALAVSLALLGSGVARADADMAGLVMGTSGTTEPAMKRLVELAPDAPIKLEAPSTLTFLHYSTCKLVTVSGPGTITLHAADWQNDGATVQKTAAGPCPKHYQVAGTAAALVLRGVTQAAPVTTRPSILLTGENAADVTSAVVFDQRATAAQGTALLVASGQVTYPANLPPLTADQRYTLQLKSKGKADPYTVPVFVSPGADEVLILAMP